MSIWLTLFSLAFLLSTSFSAPSCNNFGTRLDCGYVGINQQICENKGCCWNPFEHDPWCFFPNGGSAETYTVSNVTDTNFGITAYLTKTQNGTLPNFGPDIPVLRMDVFFETADRIHVKIYDPVNARYEVPQTVLPRPQINNRAPKTNYVFSYTKGPFGFAVTRANGELLFNTTAPASGAFNGLIFKDQYLEISTQLSPSSPNIFGFGERVRRFKLDIPKTYTLWTADVATPVDQNLYGFHPFYLQHNPSTGTSHGVFLTTSNGLDVSINPNSLTYRTVGGILDFYIFVGPSPQEVVQQYLGLIGNPHLPPYWALGWHQCKYGWHTLEIVENVVATYKSNNIPLDTIWTDIDYMNSYKDFTWDPERFPVAQVSQFINTLHANDQHYVVITDPGIFNDPSYPPYAQGMPYFVKNSTGQNFIGRVWPGTTAWPDFLNPDTTTYWKNQISTFLQQTPVDGLWIDMNEASNFCNGECDQIDRIKFGPNNPPYSINNFNSRAPLQTKTLSMDAVHKIGTKTYLEYDVHNLYGHTEGIATKNALESITNKRSLVISRSTYASSGRYVGHWLGDNHSQWSDLYYSISGVMNFALFGISLAGADICGFIGTTTEELCARWTQLGIFYTFTRNHADISSPEQEPYIWPSVAGIARQMFRIKYSLLPYYYTLLFSAHQNGTTVWRPLFFEFPADPATISIDAQFMVGSYILVSPVVTQGATSVSAYFPSGIWYDFYNKTVTSNSAIGQTVVLDAPLEKINFHIRGGGIIPLQTDPQLTTAQTRKNPFSLLAALDANGNAEGSLIWDDGISLNVLETLNFINIQYNLQTISGTGKLVSSSFGKFKTGLTYSSIVVMGVSKAPTSATINGSNLVGSQIIYDSASKSVTFTSLNISVDENFVLNWS